MRGRKESEEREEGIATSVCMPKSLDQNLRLFNPRLSASKCCMGILPMFEFHRRSSQKVDFICCNDYYCGLLEGSNSKVRSMITTPTLQIAGLHHVTAITADAQQNVDFYTKTLGLRMVKVTINYDDPGTYHLYYGDGLGRPGTLMTFFAWPNAPHAAAGIGHVTETAFAIPQGSLDFWRHRLTAANVADIQEVQRFDARGLTFRDPDSLQLSIMETPLAAGDTHLWHNGPIGSAYAIRGFHGVTLTQAAEAPSRSVIVDRFGYRPVAQDGPRIRYQAAGDAIARTLDVLVVPNAPRSRLAAGQVHHVAFRTPTDAQQHDWLDTLRTDGHNVSPIMDRDYFHSIYFREPGGVLFEIATDTPGMTINEPAAALGSRIQLPAWLEPQRAEIEAALPKITLASVAEVSPLAPGLLPNIGTT
jgi:glyoxalase family protein